MVFTLYRTIQFKFKKKTKNQLIITIILLYPISITFMFSNVQIYKYIPKFQIKDKESLVVFKKKYVIYY